MLSGLMLHRRAVLGTPKCEKSVGRRGSAPDPAGGAYSTPLPRPPGWCGGGFAAPSPRTPLTILSLCLSCVYVHTCMNVKHGTSQLYLGGASNYLAPALQIRDCSGEIMYRLVKIWKITNPLSHNIDSSDLALQLSAALTRIIITGLIIPKR